MYRGHFCACGLHRQGSMCVAVSYMCVVPIGGQVCCIRYKDIGISIVVVFLVLYIGNICVDLIDIYLLRK